jgi:hypothetical protein
MFDEIEEYMNAIKNKGASKFRMRPITIYAYKLTEGLAESFHQWPSWLLDAWYLDKGDIGCFYLKCNAHLEAEFFIHTLAGEHKVSCGDWIIRGVKGELYTCKPDIFALTYEKV